jgi:outer membrane protein assembly factor BamB
MPFTACRACVAFAVVIGFAVRAAAEPPAHWPQFRGPNASGVAPEGMKLPTKFGPNEHVVWKTPLPPGASSPCIWGDRIFLTDFDPEAKKLETFCLDRTNGQILWRRPAPADKIEKVHKVSSPAVATPAADGERVYVYFGSYGLLCYDFAGTELWKVPLPTPQTRFGTGTSPIVVGERVLLYSENLPKPFLLAVDRRTGTTAWKQEWVPLMEGYSTPIAWEHDGKTDVVTLSPARITGRDPADGKERWFVGVMCTACTTPVVGDGLLYAATYMIGGEADEMVPLPTFDQLLEKYDADKDGQISKDEFPKDLAVLRRPGAGDVPGADVKVINFFPQIDLNKDGKISRFEWTLVAAFANRKVDHGVLAIKPGGTGDVSKSHLAWKEPKEVPEIASPVYYRGRVYTVRNGLVSCLNAETGKVVYRERLGPGGMYYSSPIAADGKLYAASGPGVVTVFAAGDKFQVLARNDFGEPIMATPAVADGTLYIRTDKHLYAIKE